MLEKCNERNLKFSGWKNNKWKGSSTYLSLFCLKCGNRYETCTYINFMNDRGCPSCNESKMEILITNLLTKSGINYERKYRKFNWLKNKQNLELDFYLPTLNIGIECQGIQHFEAVEYWGGQKRLDYIQNNDKIKKELCEKNNVQLYYINYNSIEKDIEIIKNLLH